MAATRIMQNQITRAGNIKMQVLNQWAEDIGWIDSYWDKEEKLVNKNMEQPKPPKLTRAKKDKYFDNLSDFITKYNFKKTPLPWRLENESYIISQVVNQDRYGYSVYAITCKRFIDDSSFRGRLPNSIFAEEILMSIAEDYHLENLEESGDTREGDIYIDNLYWQKRYRDEHDIHICIKYEYTMGGSCEYTYEIKYFPKSKSHNKRYLDQVEYICSYEEGPGSYSGTFSSYEEALSAAIVKVNKCLIYV